LIGLTNSSIQTVTGSATLKVDKDAIIDGVNIGANVIPEIINGEIKDSVITAGFTLESSTATLNSVELLGQMVVSQSGTLTNVTFASTSVLTVTSNALTLNGASFAGNVLSSQQVTLQGKVNGVSQIQLTGGSIVVSAGAELSNLEFGLPLTIANGASLNDIKFRGDLNANTAVVTLSGVIEGLGDASVLTGSSTFVATDELTLKNVSLAKSLSLAAGSDFSAEGTVTVTNSAVITLATATQSAFNVANVTPSISVSATAATSGSIATVTVNFEGPISQTIVAASGSAVTGVGQSIDLGSYTITLSGISGASVISGTGVRADLNTGTDGQIVFTAQSNASSASIVLTFIVAHVNSGQEFDVELVLGDNGTSFDVAPVLSVKP